MMRPICLAMLAMFVAACLSQPKAACRSDEDCISGRVCVSDICQSSRRDGGLDGSPEMPEVASLDAVTSVAADTPTSRVSDSSMELGSRASADTATFDTPSESLDAPTDAPSPNDWPQDATSIESGLDSGDVEPPPLDVARDHFGPVDMSNDPGTENSDCGETGCPTDGWQTIGGTPASGPGAAYWGPSKNLSVFWRGTDDHLKHKWLAENNAWSKEEDLGGALLSDPAAASRGDDIVDVFWQGPDHRLKHKWRRSGDPWAPEEDLGVTLASAPAAVSWEPFALYVFWRSADGKLKQMSLDYASNSWTAELDLGFSLQAEPGAMVRSYGIIDVFWRGTTGSLQHIWSFNGDSWIGVQDLGGAIAADSSPTATARRDGWIDVLWRGPDDRAKHISMDLHSQWSSIEDLDGNLAGSPDATSSGDGSLDVFARDALTGQIVHRMWHERRSSE
jgi:hypothetical protein